MWEIRVFTGRDDRGRPTQTSRTVRGGKRDAQRVAVELEGGPGRASAAGRTVRDVLDEWVEHNSATWAPSSARDQRSRVKAIKTDDTFARMPVARLSVADVERWHARLRRAGKQDAGIKNLHGALRAALAQAQRWGWASSNVAALARLRTSRTQKRDATAARVPWGATALRGGDIEYPPAPHRGCQHVVTQQELPKIGTTAPRALESIGVTRVVGADSTVRQRCR